MVTSLWISKEMSFWAPAVFVQVSVGFVSPCVSYPQCYSPLQKPPLWFCPTRASRTTGPGAQVMLQQDQKDLARSGPVPQLFLSEALLEPLARSVLEFVTRTD